MWYIYYPSGDGKDLATQRPHVLKGKCFLHHSNSDPHIQSNSTGSATPWDSFSYLATLTSVWGIDGSIVRFSTWGNYFVYSCFFDSLQSLCIAPLTSPGKIGTSKVLSTLTNSWETVGNPVIEGPATMYREGKTFLSYSASYCWKSSYSLGLLTWNGSGDPSFSASWKKSGPLITGANGNYGTGNNGYDISCATSPPFYYGDHVSR